MEFPLIALIAPILRAIAVGGAASCGCGLPTAEAEHTESNPSPPKERARTRINAAFEVIFPTFTLHRSILRNCVIYKVLRGRSPILDWRRDGHRLGLSSRTRGHLDC